MPAKRSSSTHHWWKCSVVGLLTDKDYAASIRLVFKHLEPLTGRTRPFGSETFTDHDLVHSARIVYRLGQVLGKKPKLTQTEIYLLLLAALLHDAGMWVRHAEALALIDNAEFRRWAKNSAPQRLAFVESALKDEATKPLGLLGLQHLAAAWGRLHHPERLGGAVLAPENQTGKSLRELIDPAFIDPLIQVCVAHSWDRNEVVKSPLLDRTEIGFSDGPVRLRLVAALLRLGDLLDLDEGRVSTLLWDYLRPLPPISEAHWRKESTLKLKLCEPHKIELAGTFAPAGGASASADECRAIAEAYRLALDWIAMLRAEIVDCTHVIDARLAHETGLPRVTGDLDLLAEEVNAPHLAFDGPVSFRLNRQRILQLLGDEIYTDGTVFVRELLQNALDTTRAAILRKHAALSKQNPDKYPPDRPWDWPREIVQDPAWTIELDTGEEKVGDRIYVTFRIRDRGLGMTEDQIRHHFLAVGESYFRTPAFREEFRFPPISRFGIGFLSCLTVASRIKVHTRAANQPQGLSLSLQLPSDQYLVEKDASLPEGTTVQLWIDPSADLPPSWSKPPMQPDVSRLFGLPDPPEAAPAIQLLEFAIPQWANASELPIKCNGALLPGTGLTTATLKSVLGVGQAVVLPMHVFSKSGRRLGRGDVGIRVFGSGVTQPGTSMNHEPQKHFQCLHANRGIWLGSDGWRHVGILHWRADYLPRRSLSAGRNLRSQHLLSAETLAEIANCIWQHVWDALATRQPELAYLWRFTIRMRYCRLPMYYPVRSLDGLEWLTMDEIKQRHKRLLWVPAGVAIEGPWSLSVPAVALLRLPDILSSGDDMPLPINDLPFCQLVEIADRCTAVLIPRDANAADLPPVRGEITYVPNGLAACKPGVRPWTLEFTHPAMESFPSAVREGIKEHQRPAYDHRENPWEAYGFDEIFLLHPKPHQMFARKIFQLLDEFPEIQYPPNLLDFVIEDGDDWE